MPATTVFTDANSTFGAVVVDTSGVTSWKLKTGAGYAPTTDGLIGFNTTTHLPVFGFNGASTTTIPVTQSAVSGTFLTGYSQATGAFTTSTAALTTLGNLASVAINTTLLPASVNTVALGSTSLPFTNLFLQTSGAGYVSFAGLASLSAPRTITVPNANSVIPQATAGTAGQFLTALNGTTGVFSVSSLTYSGNTTELGTVSGAVTSTHAAAWDASGNLVDGGAAVTASSTTTFTNKTYNAESTGNSLSEPVKAFFSAAGCNGSSPGPSMDIGPTNVPTLACGGTTATKAYLGFARGNVAYINWHLPSDWNSSASTDIELGLITTDTNNGDVISYNVQTGCNKVDGTATDDPALNTLQAASVTIGASQISGGMLTFSKTGLTMTGCAANYNFEIALTRNNSGTDTATNTAAAVQLKFVEMTTGVTKNAANR